MDEQTLNTVLALSAVALGWALAEGSSFLKSLRRPRILRRALMTEVEDVGDWLDRAATMQEKSLMLIAHGELPGSGSTEIQTHIYDAHFPELAPSLSRDERMSFINIYNLVCSVNEDHRAFALRRQEKVEDKDLNALAAFLDRAYYNGRHARACINWHMKQGKRLKMSELLDEDMRRFDDNCVAELERIKEKAQSMTVDDVRALPG